MKILPSLGPAAAESQLAARGGAAAVSFAELLEGGAQAHELLARRALGFSEAGLLGVHFAHPQAAAQPAPALHPPTQDSGALAMSGTAWPPTSAIAPPVPETHFAAAGSPQPGLATAGPHLPSATAGDAAGLAAGQPRAAAAPSPQPARAEPIREPAQAPAPPQMPPPVRRRSPVQVRLLGGSSGLAVVVEGFLSRKDSILDLEATARAIASEYGMQISHFAVKPSRADETA